jgi:hypothetical protein
MRVSKRQRGIKAETRDDTSDETLPIALPKVVIDIVPPKPLRLPSNLYLPLTLASIGVTIWDLGRFVQGEARSAYWSSAGVRMRLDTSLKHYSNPFYDHRVV